MKKTPLFVFLMGFAMLTNAGCGPGSEQEGVEGASAAPVAAAAPSEIGQTDQALCSGSGGIARTVTFVNRRSQSIDLYYYGTNCWQYLVTQSIPPGGSYTVNTAGYVWWNFTQAYTDLSVGTHQVPNAYGPYTWYVF
ncbi:MAG TPA: hypothetical protein VFZ09_23160 [Archangium sp.]|uniref:hypothetical protein n=1 Tax=Archangium sp. TaxID=1872627 RepID=UPI002E347752|nr:hypothetical protein [Archangium sp.]HEX5749161.1 hypothetical protein [Archangium sp.]